MANLFTDRLLVYVEDIDEQHRRIFDIVEEFYKACMGVKDKDRILDIFKVLKGSLEEHFKSEENYMVKYNYPEYEAHKEKHNIFMLKLQALDRSFKGNFILFTKLMEANEFFAERFVTHISDVDNKLGEFLRDKL